MNYKKHTLLLVSAVVLLSAGVVGVAMAQSVLFDKDIDLQGTKKILNAMNIGIGTASPVGRLQIGATSYATVNAAYQFNMFGPLNIMQRDAAADSYIVNNAFFNSSGAWQRILASGAGMMNWNSDAVGAMAFKVAPTGTAGSTFSWVDAITILGDGKVGIGTITPSSRLTISPVSSISADMLSGRIQNLASPVNTADAATKNYVDTVAAGGTLWTLGATEMNVYTTNSRGVGIGTATPLHKLDIIGSYYSRTVVKGTCSGTVAIDWTLGNTQHCVLGSTPVTFTFSGAQSGGNYKLILKQDGTGSRTVSWPATIRWGSGSAPYLTPTPLKTDYVGFIYNGVDGYYDSVAFNANF